jgi:hypothetical protein
MLSSEVRVQTDVPRRCLGQLCKHFQHKLPVTLDETRGRIEFAAGVCEVDASPDGGMLLLRVTAPDEDGLARLEDVVARHLERFAFREELRVAWHRTA